MKRLFSLLLVYVLIAVPAIAQVQSGTIAGTVKDEQGGVLPGVTVTLTSTDRTASFTTEADGRFRFLNLAAGVLSRRPPICRASRRCSVKGCRCRSEPASTSR